MASDKKSEDLKSLSSVCLICYKSFINTDNVNERIGTSLKLLFRQLKLNTGIGLDSIETCVDCSLLLESYGEIYHQWKLLELQLQCRIQEISSVIRTAGRIPKRVQAFKAWCNNQDNNGQDKLGLGSDFRELRSRLKLECMNQSKTFPRLTLSRVDMEMIGKRDQKALFIGWLTSCIAVAALSNFNNGSTDKIQQLQLEEIPIDEDEVRPSVNPQIQFKMPVDTGPAHKSHRKQCPVCHNSYGHPEVVEEPPGEQLNSNGEENCFENIKNSFLEALSLKPVVNKRMILNRASKFTGRRLKFMAVNSEYSKDDVPTVSTIIPMDMSPTVSAVCLRGSQRCQCDNCGQWFSRNHNLARHLSRNRCLYAKRMALNKLDAFLDFICNICNKQFHGDSKNSPRYLLQRHLATVHRFHHKNGEDYRHLKLRHALPIFFCLFCGLKEPKASAIVRHLRISHRELLGVSKKTPDMFPGRAYTPMETDPNGSIVDLKEPFKPSEVSTIFPTSRTSVVNNLKDILATDKALTLKSSSSRPRSRCYKCGRWFQEKWSMFRHVKRNSCGYAEREALIKFDASLDFICPICNKEFKNNCGARRILEYHIASGHRFDHENAQEYRHLKLGKAPGIYFCAICGSRETSRIGLADHLRKTHKELLGVPKKTANVESSLALVGV